MGFLGGTPLEAADGSTAVRTIHQLDGWEMAI
jgi:hypothetical protein